jgi:hypothetical protein
VVLMIWTGGILFGDGATVVFEMASEAFDDDIDFVAFSIPVWT